MACGLLGTLQVVLGAACSPAAPPTVAGAPRDRGVLRQDLFQAVASNGKVLAAATAGGSVLSSDDGGQTWQRHALAGTASIVAMAACPDGSFVGLDFYRRAWTAPAQGRPWTPHAIDTPEPLITVACDRHNHLWAAGGHSRILASEDGGKTWAARFGGDDSILTTLQFLGDGRGHALGEFGLHLVTQDGGRSWQKQAPLPGDFYPYAAVFRADGQAWASGLAGVVLHSRDAGRTWSRQANPADAALYALVPLGDALYGLGFGGAAVVARGDAWSRYDHGRAIPGYLAAGAAHGDDALLVAGAGGALHLLRPSSAKTVARAQ